MLLKGSKHEDFSHLGLSVDSQKTTLMSTDSVILNRAVVNHQGKLKAQKENASLVT